MSIFYEIEFAKYILPYLKQGKMQDLGIELERQNMGKKDYLVNTSQLSMETSVFKYTVLSL